MSQVHHFGRIGIVEFPPPLHEARAPEAWLRFWESGAAQLCNFLRGEEVLVLVWFDPFVRLWNFAGEKLRRGEISSETFHRVAAIRSPNHNPLRVHRVTVLARDHHRLRVRGLVAIEGMEVLEVLSVLEQGPGH